MSEVIKSYKGFDKDLKCRGFQYEIGKEYEEPTAKACSSGFHACEMPLDVLSYYAPGNQSRYCVVEQSGVISKHADDTKVASSKIKIGAEIGIPGLIKAQIEYVKNICKNAPEQIAQGDSGHAAAQGDGGHAAAQGYSGHAAAQGDRGHAAAQGYSGHAAAQGDSGHAAAQGDGGHAAAQGDGGHAAAQGYSGHAAAQGDGGHAAAQGDRGHAAAQGDRGHAEVHGKNAIAAAFGINGKAKAPIGSAIMLAEYDDEFDLVAICAKIIDGQTLKPNTWYTLKNGKITECE